VDSLSSASGMVEAEEVVREELEEEAFINNNLVLSLELSLDLSRARLNGILSPCPLVPISFPSPPSVRDSGPNLRFKTGLISGTSFNVSESEGEKLPSIPIPIPKSISTWEEGAVSDNDPDKTTSMEDNSLMRSTLPISTAVRDRRDRIFIWGCGWGCGCGWGYGWGVDVGEVRGFEWEEAEDEAEEGSDWEGELEGEGEWEENESNSSPSSPSSPCSSVAPDEDEEPFGPFAEGIGIGTKEGFPNKFNEWSSNISRMGIFLSSAWEIISVGVLMSAFRRSVDGEGGEVSSVLLLCEVESKEDEEEGSKEEEEREEEEEEGRERRWATKASAKVLAFGSTSFPSTRTS
jgi:hypothetical protein